jgi:hypothetical protein
MFVIKKLVFKFMELGLGLKTFFALETRNPVFINFKLTPEDVAEVQRNLPDGWRLRAIPFTTADDTPEYWLSYNFYELKYPTPRLAHIRKARGEINTFVEDPKGKCGIFVFGDSPYVSREHRTGVLGQICDVAERVVIFIYGCGKLTSLDYELQDQLRVSLHEPRNDLNLNLRLEDGEATVGLSESYLKFNDVSFFNRGRTFDLVNASSDFYRARFRVVDSASFQSMSVRTPFFSRAPDAIYYHRGDIAYLVNAMNRA